MNEGDENGLKQLEGVARRALEETNSMGVVIFAFGDGDPRSMMAVSARTKRDSQILAKWADLASKELAVGDIEEWYHGGRGDEDTYPG